MKAIASPRAIRPLGSSRIAVRGLVASCAASARRLNPMAALRAVTMQARIQPRRVHDHDAAAPARTANSAPTSANGKANTV